MPRSPFRPDILWYCFVCLIRGPVYATIFAFTVYPLWKSIFVGSEGGGESSGGDHEKVAGVDYYDSNSTTTTTASLSSSSTPAAASLPLPPIVIFVVTAHLPREIIFAMFWAFFWYFGNSQWLKQYSMHPNASKPESTLRRKAVIHIIKQHFCIQPAFSIVFFHYFANNVSANPAAPIPSTMEIFLHFVKLALLNDVVFFLLHGALHLKPFYGRYHSEHHQYRFPTFESGDYAHPYETLVFVALPIFVQCAEGKDHMFLFMVNSMWRVWQNYELHCGYNFGETVLCRKFGLLHGTQGYFHEFHHTSNKGYGVTMLMDYLCGTMGEFLEAHPPSKLNIWTPWSRDCETKEKNLKKTV